MQRRLARLQQRHALLGTGHQQRRQLEISDDFHAALNQLFFSFALARHRFELREVGRQQGCAAIALEIGAFRVDQHRNAGFARQLDHGLHARQRAFGIIRQHQRADIAQRLANTLVQRLRINAFESFFEIEADQLLVTRQDAQLGDGWVGRNRNEVALHVHVRQRLTQGTRRIVNAGQAHQTRMRAQRGYVHRHVCRAAWTLFNGVDLNYRHRRFRRDTAGRPIPVAIQHHITDNHNSSTFKLWQCYFHS